MGEHNTGDVHVGTIFIDAKRMLDIINYVYCSEYGHKYFYDVLPKCIDRLINLLYVYDNFVHIIPIF